MTQNGEFKYLGKGRKIIDGLEKVTGHARYAADVKLPNMLYARPILSPYPNATILSVDKSAAEEMPGVVAVLTADDLPTRSRKAISRNSAVLAQGQVLWVGQPVAVVVAESELAAADAAEMVFVEYDPQPAAVLLEDAMRPDAPVVWPNGLPSDEEDMSSLHAQVEEGDEGTHGDAPNNTSKEHHFTRGDVAAGFAEADVIVERTYRTSMVHQAYMEAHAVVAEPDLFGRAVTLYTSTQGQYTVRDEVAKLMGLPRNAVVIKPMTVGGAFGAKYGIFEPLAAAVALTLRQPVRLALSRSEDFLSTTPAPQTIIELKTGAKRDGSVTAVQARIYIDNGIFSFNHGGIMTMLLGGYYKWPHLKVDAYEINTHKPQVGAYRAPGAPQATFAIESHIEDMAREIGMDSLEFRLKNVVEGGDLMGVGQPWAQNIGLKQCLERLQQHPLWQNRRPGDGTGLAIGGWPTVQGTAETTCRVDTDGTVRLNVGIVDISGSKSSLVLVAAEALGVSPDDIVIVQDDTQGAYGPNSGGSQVTYTMAGAIEEAALNAKRQLQAVAAEEFEAAEEDIDIVDGQAQVRGVPDRKISIGQLAQMARSKQGGGGPIVGEGKSAPPETGPAFVAHLVKVEVDRDAGTVRPTEYVAVQDVGFALNPTLVEGQMQGGALQGLGFALHEAMVYDENGQLLTGTFMDYGIPRIDDAPHLDMIYIENPSPFGPFGARGIAEPPITAGPAAVANAIKDATGVRVTQLPIRREAVWQALHEKG